MRSAVTNKAAALAAATMLVCVTAGAAVAQAPAPGEGGGGAPIIAKVALTRETPEYKPSTDNVLYVFTLP